MEGEKSTYGFDEIAREAAEHLLEQFWIIRDKEPVKYRMVRDREQVLRNYFLEKTGFRLIMHRHFIKLEKIPVQPETWMGIQSFRTPRDYAVFCCLLAFMESKTVDEQFLLSDLCEELQSLFPSEESLDWTHYEHRKSLVRVLQTGVEMGIVQLVDGDIAQFNYSESSEVLYEVPVVSRYFMRSYPKDLLEFETKEQILAAEWWGKEDISGVQRRHRVYRQLFLSPVTYRNEKNDPDFLYLRNFRNRIREDIERHTEFQFELYRNTALLTLPERKARFTLFPDNKAISDIALHFAAVVREQLEKEEIYTQPDGTLRLTPVDFEGLVRLCKERYGVGWSKQYREGTVSVTAKELLEHLTDWRMADRDGETGVIILYPLLARLTGDYPRDYKDKVFREVNTGEK
ncbi:MAG: TIGR02678 family protein [Firmicutes bacterium]|nr:TIGR02678 family protein [Bacillota bacterium]